MASDKILFAENIVTARQCLAIVFTVSSALLYSTGIQDFDRSTIVKFRQFDSMFYTVEGKFNVTRVQQHADFRARYAPQ